MNTFKPLFMLLICFAMASLSFSTESIANDTPYAEEALACNISTVTPGSPSACDGSNQYSVPVVVEFSASNVGDVFTVTLTRGGTNIGSQTFTTTAAGTQTQTITVTGIAGGDGSSIIATGTIDCDGTLAETGTYTEPDCACDVNSIAAPTIACVSATSYTATFAVGVDAPAGTVVTVTLDDTDASTGSFTLTTAGVQTVNVEVTGDPSNATTDNAVTGTATISCSSSMMATAATFAEPTNCAPAVCNGITAVAAVDPVVGDCTSSTTYDLTVNVTGDFSANTTVTVVLSGGASATATAIATGTPATGEVVAVTFTGVVTDNNGTTVTVTATEDCTGTTASTTDPDGFTEPDCSTVAPACQDCYTNNQYINDANTTDPTMAGTMGGELCDLSPASPETFTGNGALFTNGTVGSTAARTVLIQAKTSVTMEAGTMFDAMGTGMITVNVDPTLTDCVPLTDEDGEVARNIVVDNNNIAAGASVMVTPNPFSSSATINYTLGSEEQVVVSVYNMRGEKVATLMNGLQVAGTHSVNFDASNLPKGFYYLSLRTSTEQVTEQMVIMR